jgi:hypothetical protein
MDATSIALAILVAAMWACVWAYICNERTFRQRKRLIETVFAAPNWQQLKTALDSVTYRQHMWRLMAFGDPLPMYGEDIALRVSGRK